MKYNNKELILDNFRKELCTFSIDVQDIVRSAILDGIDISRYINQCVSNPYRLDQIRLCLKEGISEEYMKIASGEVLFRLREMWKKGVNLTPMKTYLSITNPDILNYVLSWVEDGVPLEGINPSLIPCELLEVFDFGLRHGYNMVEFNTGRKFPPEYLRYLLKIRGNNKPVDNFIKYDWDLEVIKQLSMLAGASNQYWMRVVRYIDYTISAERLMPLLRCVDSGMTIRDINKKDEDGNYVYDLRCITIMHNAFLNKLDCRKLLEETTAEGMQDLYNEMELEKRKKSAISGRLRKTNRGQASHVN